MTNEQWDDWVRMHRTLFWMHSPQDADLFAQWRKLLGTGSYHPLELADASRHVVALVPLPFRDKHLGLMRQHIFGLRAARMIAERAEIERAAMALECKLCAGCGLVAVPHDRAIVNDAWVYPYYETVVTCPCPMGASAHNRINAHDIYQIGAGMRRNKVRVMDLAEYEYLHPEWRGLVRDRVATREHEHAAQWRARLADAASPVRAGVVALAQHFGDDARPPASRAPNQIRQEASA